LIYIGGIYGGPEVRGSAIDRAISKLSRLRGPGTEDERGSLDVVFHVPGSIIAPDYSGIRTGRFSKKKRLLQIQVSVPKDITAADEPTMEMFLLQALRDAIQLAVPVFDHAEIPYPHDEYVTLLDRMQRDAVQ
jgi:hypothetical protein